jgi:hypothetical protein
MNQSPKSIVGCDAVNEHVSKPIPSILWHYTTYAGFQGIVVSKKIWATEFLHAKELAQELVEQEPASTGEVFPARHVALAPVGGVLAVMQDTHSDSTDLLTAHELGHLLGLHDVCSGGASDQATCSQPPAGIDPTMLIMWHIDGSNSGRCRLLHVDWDALNH